MECRDAKPYLPLYPDRDEPPEVLDALRVHLERCASCAAELKRLQAAWDALNAWDGMEPPAGLAARVRERARGAQRPARRIRWISLATAAAALLVAAILTRVVIGPPAPAALSSSEIEIVRNLDLLENYEMVVALDFLNSGASLDDVGPLMDLLPPPVDAGSRDRKGREH
jgi:hypothetical protein